MLWGKYFVKVTYRSQAHATLTRKVLPGARTDNRRGSSIRQDAEVYCGTTGRLVC